MVINRSRPGRPKGSKNKNKSPRRKSRSRRRPGRPKGSKNKSPRRKSRIRRRPGRPKGSKNKNKSPRRKSRSRRRPGRPKGSRNKNKFSMVSDLEAFSPKPSPPNKDIKRICDSDYFYGKEMACGTQGCIHELCDSKNNCSENIVKIVPAEIVNEKINYIASSIGVGPKIKNIFKCKYKGSEYSFVISQKLDNTLTSLNNNPKGSFPYKRDKISVTDNDLQQIERLVNLLLQNGIFHNDLSMDNIMYKINKDGSKKWYLIDYDLSVLIEDIGTIKYDQLIRNNSYIKYTNIPINLNAKLVKSMRPLVDYTPKELERKRKLEETKKENKRKRAERVKARLAKLNLK